MSIPKSSQKSWSQTMRNLVRKRFLGKTAPNKAGPAPAEHPKSPAPKNNKKASAKRLPSAETEASGTGSSQTWEDYGEWPFFLSFFSLVVKR